MSSVIAGLPLEKPPPENVEVTLGDVMLWGVLPYVVIAVLVLGSVWRYRYDQFGWTTRSSQLYEARILRIASPLFHFGILAVIVGHVVGLLIPRSWTEGVGISDSAYHAMALSIGIIAGIGTLVGIVLLIYRRRTTGPVFMATTKNDKLMYVVLLGALLAGLATTMISVFDENVTAYRETVSPWFRSIFIFQPDIVAMTAASLSFKIHTLWGLALFAIWPFTRLVHAFTAPLHYLFRPYIVYRSRGKRPVPGAQPARPGWAPVGTPDRDRRGLPRQ
ncbi:respiratory nitrate reductase subunit gamma [Arthrobacter sp. Sa2BUA2]|uniref:Respiratory nitrate reductase subunit gamma n=1 Tax=Arthrobacter pullicola TaxID=2762224 RepID=A0ABR8YKB3_9MICC|nr:respiratory nitrate reductase subunit gamma [Arthrobacter pullicola]MBD8044483.1 respiratory nitrate reductase subunit gamma [Arthrobacter pullicola]